MFLFRPVGEDEMLLIKSFENKRFPERLPNQPIFYPVLNQRYAEEIAERWNTKDEISGFKGYVLKFEIDDLYIFQFKVQTVGKSYHKELWIPAEELDNFNNYIIGDIEVLKCFG